MLNVKKQKKVHNERQWDIYYTYFQSIIFRFLRIWQSYRLLQTKRINKYIQLEKLRDKKSHTFTEKKDEVAMEWYKSIYNNNLANIYKDKSTKI